MIYNFFDKAFVINLPDRKLRLSRISRRLKNLHIEFEIVEGIIPPFSKKLIHNKGHLGATLSHLYIWEKAKREKYKFFLVFEDDALFRDDSEEIFKESITQLPTNWDMFFMGFCLLGKNTKISNNIFSFEKGCHFHAYAVNSKALNYIIKKGKIFIENMKNGKKGFIDNFIMSDIQLKKYHIHPILSVQEPSFSNTGGGNRLNEYFKVFSKEEFVKNCKELAEWYKGNKKIYD